MTQLDTQPAAVGVEGLQLVDGAADPGGQLAQAGGRASEAERHVAQSLAIHQALGDDWGLGISTANQAASRFEAGDHDAAVGKLTQSVAHDRRAGAKSGVEECFELLAQIAQHSGHLERAAWCWGVVERLEHDIGKVLSADRKPVRERALRTLQTRMPQGMFEVARATGRQDTLEASWLAVLHPAGFNA